MALTRYAAIALWAIAAAASQPAAADDGLQIFKSANCAGCHKWSGVGGGGYGGAAANLRQTTLSIQQIEETIRCGRPATGMPHFAADAYADRSCYGLKAADLTNGTMPPEPDHPLRPSDIHDVATYVVTHIKGQGEPNLAQCEAFFGTGSRVCDVYAEQGSHGSPLGHMKVDAATDANSNSVRK
jgi:Cytochrome C oxidase, cbb3-type, subunit III